jgi:FtsP/CotA-like multicopper oxidase with cupredoxin domain
MNRRKFLLASSALPAAFLLKGCGSNPLKPVAPLFTVALPIPKELNPVATAGAKIFNLSINAGTHQFFDKMNADTFYVSETGDASATTYLGPTLRLTNGENITINYKNNLSESTTMHGHGMHLPANMDGTPHQTIEPGQTWTAQYTVNQDACTNWYHPHAMHKTASHVYKGLTGMIIIDDDNSVNLDLPLDYGNDDIPLIIQDKEFNYSGNFIYTPSHMQIMQGFKGSYFMVNGAITPFVSVEAKQIRFRLLNGSNSRVYNFSLGGKPFTQIAGDNSFLESGVEMTSLQLSPAERVEIIVDFSADKDGSFILKDTLSNSQLMNITVDKEASVADTSLPQVLTTLEALPATIPAVTHTFSLTSGMGGGMPSMLKIAIDGNDAKAMDINVIDLRIPKDEVQVWEITNDMPMTHNFHVHGGFFRVIERKVGDTVTTVPDNEKGYKDTVRIDGKGSPMGTAHSVKILIKMTDYTDSTVPYMFHCHILEHEDAGMMGQFVVE